MPELPKLPKLNARSLANLKNLKKIAAKTGERLQQIPIEKIKEWESRYGYSCAEAGNVTGLNLRECNIKDISFLTDFPRLTHLSLWNNQISDISPLQALTQLNILDLRNNQIADLSPLQALTQLTWLNLENNQVADLSPLKALTQLKELYLHNNQVADLAPLQALTQLNELSLGANQITDISPLKALIQKMEIKWEYDGTSGIFLAGNPLEIPPVEIVQQGTAAVRNYFKEIEESSVLLLQCKLLLVGAGAVGKTTLMKKLLDNNYRVEVGKEDTTRGIDIIPWELTCSFPSGKTLPVKLYSWDFGGQDIMYTTHQFFLTRRSLYIFVWEARLEGQENAGFDYWLNIIKLLSDNSPVLIVLNKSEVRSKHLDEASFKDKFKNIAGFLQVSCATGHHIPELIEQIRCCLCSMKHLEDKLPQAWMDIRDDLKELNKDYISLAEYFDMCAQRGLNRERADFLSDYLHDLGAILHFRSDALLENTVILNPEWATAAFYRIMDTTAILENKGRFHYAELKTLWDEKTFPAEKHPQLLRLMERFELCFPVAAADLHIVPELLPAKKPEGDFKRYGQPGALHFEYHYDFMPRGILSRLISRLYYLIREEHFWASGVELMLDNTFALVSSEPLKRKLSATVCGAEKNELLAIVRQNLEVIHRSLNMTAGEHYQEMIPCCCTACLTGGQSHLFTHQVLKRFTGKNITHIQCQVSGEQVLIAGLLKGFAPPPQKTDLKELLAELIKSAARLQGRAKAIRSGENDRNSFIAELLTARGYIVKDQIRWGSSASGKAPGEPDMLVVTPDASIVSVIEAFNLPGLRRGVIESHFKKIFDYDTNGLENNYLLVYAESDNFIDLWQKYITFLPSIETKYKMQGPLQTGKSPYTDIKIARTKHNRHDRETAVYHLFVNMKI